MLSKIKAFFIKLKELLYQYKKTTVTLGSIFLFWLFFFHYTDVNEVAICRNIVTGDMYLDSIPGPNITAPWVQVAKIDTRPQRLCIECNCRNINCFLVSFDYSGWKDFVNKEGFRYYWWSNRFSFNMGHKKTYRGMDDILKSYAFDGSKYKFIKIEQRLSMN